MNTQHGQSDFCPVFHKSVELIGRRWSGAIIRAMRNDRCRFSDIAHAIPGLSDRLLSERLKELEFEGIVSRTVIPETPVKIEYHLTEKGRDLDAVMQAISEWAIRWVEPIPRDLDLDLLHPIESTFESGEIRQLERVSGLAEFR